MSSLVKIGVLGADGRMGCAVIRAIAARKSAELTVALTAKTSTNLGKDAYHVAGLSTGDVALSTDIEAGLKACDVLIDFSAPRVAIDTALAMHGSSCKAMVTGTTGYSATEEAALMEAGEQIALLKSGNFSLGICVLEALVEQAARALTDGWDVEVLEMHHRHKVDAPSGTGLMLGRAAAKGRGVNLDEVQAPIREGRDVARQDGDIGFAVLRGGGVIGDHEVRLASDLEMITLGHQAFDRSVFAEGALSAALWAVKQPKGTYDLRDMLGLSL